MGTILASAFSLGMVAQGADVEIRSMSAGDFRSAFEVPVGCTQEGKNETFHPTYAVRVGRAVVGHPATAEALSKLLGVPIPVSRESIALSPGDVLMVAQVVGRQAVSGAEVAAHELSYFSVRVYAPRTLDNIRAERSELRETVAELEALRPPPPQRPQTQAEALKALGGIFG